MIRDEMLFPKAVKRTDSCEPMVNVMGVNMGICLILTAIVAMAAILGCLLLLICVKLATDRDERRLAAAGELKRALEEGNASSSVSADTNTAETMEADEREALAAKFDAYAENDI